MPGRSVRENPRSSNVVQHGFLGMVFHEGNMFVGGRVIDYVRPVLGKKAVDHVGVSQIAYRRDTLDTVRIEFHIDFEQRGLGHIEQHERSWSQHRDLPRDFRADGSSRSRDKHGSAPDEIVHLCEVGLYRFTFQEILVPDVSNDSEFVATGHEVLYRRQDAEMNGLMAARVDQLAYALLAGPRHGNENLLYVQLAYEFWCIRERSQHADAVYGHLLGSWIVVDKADYIVG
jgi:hypothetical protein